MIATSVVTCLFDQRGHQRPTRAVHHVQTCSVSHGRLDATASYHHFVCMSTSARLMNSRCSCAQAPSKHRVVTPGVAGTIHVINQ